MYVRYSHSVLENGNCIYDAKIFIVVSGIPLYTFLYPCHKLSGIITNKYEFREHETIIKLGQITMLYEDNSTSIDDGSIKVSFINSKIYYIEQYLLSSSGYRYTIFELNIPTYDYETRRQGKTNLKCDLNNAYTIRIHNIEYVYNKKITQAFEYKSNNKLKNEFKPISN